MCVWPFYGEGPMHVIILAAGRGTRLGALGHNVPKCLLPIGKRTLLDRQLEQIARFGLGRPTVVVGTQGSCWNEATLGALRERPVDLVLNDANETTQNVYSMWLGLRYAEPESALLWDGDLLVEDRVLAALLAAREENVLLTRASSNHDEPGTRVLVGEGRRVVQLGKKLRPALAPWQLHSGLFKIGRLGMDWFRSCVSNPSNHRQELEAAARQFIEREPLFILSSDARNWVNVNTSSDAAAAEHALAAWNV